LAPVDLSVDSNPTSVAVGDVDGNGTLDLVVANQASGTVSVLLGNGDGSFQKAVSYAAGLHPVAVVLGHFHDPHVLDLAVANVASGTVSILLGNGDGSFKAAQSYAAGHGPISLAVGDFNGDGTDDLAVANNRPNPITGVGTVSVLLGNGDGSFKAPLTYAAGSSPRWVAVGHFHDPKILDLAVADEWPSGKLNILLGNGDGTFQAATSYVAGSYLQSVAVGDFNGDGIADLAAANEFSNTVQVLLGNGDGSFQPATSYFAGNNPVSVAVADVNGDGVPDLVVANEFHDTVNVLLGNGDGSFQASQGYATGLDPYAVAVGDFNGDGFPDLAVANITGTLSVLLNDGQWPAHPGSPSSPGGTRLEAGQTLGSDRPTSAVAPPITNRSLPGPWPAESKEVAPAAADRSQREAVDRLFVAGPIAAQRSVVTLAQSNVVGPEADGDDLLGWSNVWSA
jgi:hypothetical protein